MVGLDDEVGDDLVEAADRFMERFLVVAEGVQELPHLV